jgi:DNA ligase 1
MQYKLYKKTSNNKINIWEIEIDGNKYRTIYGQENGKLIISAWTICYGKNIGKSNETSDEEQALSEAVSLYNKKIEREGYVKDKSGVNKSKIQPMLAKNYEDEKRKLVFQDGVWVNNKYNGVRVLLINNKLVSRTNKEFVNMPHISKELKKYSDKGIIFDGEAYNDKLKEDLGSLISIVNTRKPTKESLEESEKIVQFWVYDIVDDNLTYDERYKKLEKIFSKNTFKYIRLAPRWQVYSHDEIEEYLKKHVKNKDEGVIVRNNGVYEYKRSDSLLKHKLFIDEEFEIIGYKEGKGKLANKIGALELKAKNGNTFEAALVGSHKYWGELYVNRDKLIGKLATIKYKELSPITKNGKGGVPMHAKGVSIRDYD